MNPIWLKYYPPGVPHTIDPDIFSSINSLMDWIFEQYDGLPAFSNMDKVISFAELNKQSRYMAAFLTNELGLSKGDRVAIMMPNILQYPITMLGILRAGCIVVNINFLYTSEEFERQVNDSQATALVILDNFAHIAAEVIHKTQIKHVVLTKIGDVLSLPKSLMVNFYLKYIKRKIPKWHFDSFYTYKQALELGSKLPCPHVNIVNSDLAYIQYTGGTSGIPKGAMLTHRNIVAEILILTAWSQGLLLPRVEISATVLPIFHIGGTMGFLYHMYRGGLNLLITNPMQTGSFISAVKKTPFTIIYGVNGLYKALMNDPAFATLDFSKLKNSSVSGMELQRSVAMRWEHITKKVLVEAYGMTETSLAVCSNPVDSTKLDNTVGMPLPSTELSIRNDVGDELGIEHPGEIWVRGPQLMLGYWNKEEETKNVLTSDGWFKTGDVGIIDERGHLRVIDRKKDIIMILGFQVYPSEVEKVIASMPEVKEVAVVDAFDAIDGEIVKAFIVPNDPNLTQENVITYCEANLLYYKVPKVVEFRKTLPKSSVGKILRRALRSEG